jgi:opacity protein-like surface antigen
MLAAGLASAWSAAAADMDMDSDAGGNTGHIYANGDAGVSILQNITFRGAVAQMDVGPKVDVSVGYNLTQNIAVEVQSGYAYNSWSRVDGQSLPSGESVDIWSVPVMANGIYKVAINNHWQAYGGLGAGVLISTLDQNTPGNSISPTDCEFAYQAMFGIKYRVNDHLSCGLGYNFLGSLDHHWNGNGGGVTTSPTYMHSVLLSATWTF